VLHSISEANGTHRRRTTDRSNQEPINLPENTQMSASISRRDSSKNAYGKRNGQVHCSPGQPRLANWLCQIPSTSNCVSSDQSKAPFRVRVDPGLEGCAPLLSLETVRAVKKNGASNGHGTKK
jgi:hypothetical protein